MRKHAPFSILSFKTFSAVATLVYRSGNEQTYYHLWTHLIVFVNYL